jgi:hypothetical protein
MKKKNTKNQVKRKKKNAPNTHTEVEGAVQSASTWRWGGGALSPQQPSFCSRTERDN